ncbi:hypothetical protein OH76DRAFT_943941 [Lentinus brumalis]|uniref:Uncharacterized protein n=1 Tax=Lentinus brumalis TaxID=2498619 RepID=A0A371CZ21_9APHY|nr:hypothetical protein OH76DRAFT_943941 [Polyporus brumalis]
MYLSHIWDRSSESSFGAVFRTFREAVASPSQSQRHWSDHRQYIGCHSSRQREYSIHRLKPEERPTHRVRSDCAPDLGAQLWLTMDPAILVPLRVPFVVSRGTNPVRREVAPTRSPLRRCCPSRQADLRCVQGDLRGDFLTPRAAAKISLAASYAACVADTGRL